MTTKTRKAKTEKPKARETFSWRNGSRYGVKAEAFAGVLRCIEVRDGVATAGAVVEAARPTDSPIHSLFNWDDTEAARLYREEQARGAIRSLRVVVTFDEAPKETGPHIAYINVHKGDQRGYVNAPEVMASVTMRDEAVEAAKAAFLSLRERHRALSKSSDELRELFELMDGWAG